MFNNLIESSSHTTELKRRGSFFLFTVATYAVLFVIAGVALFACVARGFGSTRVARDLAFGLVLSLGVFLFFVKLLNVNLPAGWLKPLLGSAGI